MTDQTKPLILVVDDYQDAREMYAEYLQFSGFRVAEASTGNEAVDQAFALRPDLILMDLSLPGHGRMGGDPAAEEPTTVRSTFPSWRSRDMRWRARPRARVRRAATRSSPSRACRTTSSSRSVAC
jgi:hypothetical protein